MKILDKYLIKNFTVRFFTLMGIFSIVITSSQLLHLPSFAYGMNLIDFSQLLILMGISFLKYQILFGFFISWLLVGIHLRENNEIYAIYSLGVSQKQLLKPVFITTIVFSIVALLISNFLVPYSNRVITKFLTVKVKNYVLESIQPKNFSKINESISVYVENKEENTLKNVIIYNKSNKFLVTAKEGNFYQNKLILNDGYIHIPSDKSFNVIKYEKYSFNLDTSYIKDIPMEDYKSSQLTEVFLSKGQEYKKAFAVLVDRIFFVVPFIFIGFIGFLSGLNLYKSKESLLSFVISVSIFYMLMSYFFVKLIEKNILFSLVYLFSLLGFFGLILKVVWKKVE